MAIDRRTTLHILRRLAQTRLGERLVLGGSSCLYAASEKIPALTEDVDLLIDADWVAAHEAELLAEVTKAGFAHHPGTCTLTAEDGASVDLVGYSKIDRDDRVGGGQTIPVMVFGDLSQVMASVDSVVEVSSGGQALSPAALTVAKLLTIRLEKGSKDKLQALLLLDELSGDEDFLGALRQLFEQFDRDRIDDALADAQMALLSISTDTDVADKQIEGYKEMKESVARGLSVLEKLVRNGEER